MICINITEGTVYFPTIFAFQSTSTIPWNPMESLGFFGFFPVVRQRFAMSDRDALLCLYESTKGPRWYNKKSEQGYIWFDHESYRGWYGVEVDEGGHVRVLNLPENRLEGKFPDSTRLKRLTGLTDLNLTYNILSGVLPKSIGYLQSLQRLHLGWNRFSGPFPSAILQLKYMRNLRLDHNEFTGPLPPELGENFPAMEHLDLSFNKFDGVVPDEIKTYTTLRYIDLRNNLLEGFFPVDILAYRAWVSPPTPPPEPDEDNIEEGSKLEEGGQGQDRSSEELFIDEQSTDLNMRCEEKEVKEEEEEEEGKRLGNANPLSLLGSPSIHGLIASSTVLPILAGVQRAHNRDYVFKIFESAKSSAQSKMTSPSPASRDAK